jgi:hypothetical protein
MFNWFKRRDMTPAAPRNPKPGTSARPASPASDLDDEDPYSAALPEIVAEGNSQDDWSMWEDSMTALDGKIRELRPAPPRAPARDRPGSRDDSESRPDGAKREH